jgi:hypothetical protein
MIILELFILVLLSFPIYVAINKVWVRLHIITKLIYGVFVFIGYLSDWILGNTVFVILFREFPSLTEGTISHRTKAHQHDSRLAKFIWDEIRKIDPNHLD